MEKMTFRQFMDKVGECFPNAEVDEDNDGQIVIYTDLMQESDKTGLTTGFVVPYVDPNDESDHDRLYRETGIDLGRKD